MVNLELRTFEIRMADGSSWFVDEPGREAIINSLEEGMGARQGRMITMNEGVELLSNGDAVVVPGPVTLIAANIVWVAPIERTPIPPTAEGHN